MLVVEAGVVVVEVGGVVVEEAEDSLLAEGVTEEAASGEDGVSLSMSMELWPPSSLTAVMAERRLSSSGGRFKGWESLS